MKRIVSILLACVLCLALCACSGGGDGPGDKPGNKVEVLENGRLVATGSDYVDGITVAPLKDAKVSIMLSTTVENMKNLNLEGNPDTFYQTMNVWKATYGVDVEVRTVVWDDFTTYLATAVASDIAPDVALGGTTWFPSWPANGLSRPLDEHLDLTEDIWNMDIMNQMKWKDKHYVAFSGDPEYFYICYNKTKFKLAGETTPLEHWKNGNWNWTQFVKTAVAMSDPANDEFGYNGWNFALNKCIYPLIDMSDSAQFKSLLTDQKVVRWFTEIYNFYHTNAARTDANKANFLKLFPVGKDAMIHISGNEYVTMRKQLAATGGDEFEIAPNPVFDPNGETDPLMFCNVYGYSITSTSKNPEAAAELIRLNYLIGRNVSKSFGDLGQFGTYLSEDEKAAILQVNKLPTNLNFTLGFGNIQHTFNNNVGSFVYSSTAQGSVSSLLDAFDPTFQAALNEFSKNLQ